MELGHNVTFYDHHYPDININPTNVKAGKGISIRTKKIPPNKSHSLHMGDGKEEGNRSAAFVSEEMLADRVCYNGSSESV